MNTPSVSNAERKAAARRRAHGERSARERGKRGAGRDGARAGNAVEPPSLLPPVEQQLLQLILADPSSGWYRSMLARQLEMAVSSLQRPLDRLTRLGMLKTEKNGRRVIYRADARHPVYPELAALIEKLSSIEKHPGLEGPPGTPPAGDDAIGSPGHLHAALRRHAAAIDVAFIFGDRAARSPGSREAGSVPEIDLFVVGTVARAELEASVNAAGDALGATVNLSLLVPSRFAEEANGWNPFVRGVLDAPRAFVIGDDAALSGAMSPPAAAAPADRPSE